MFAADPVDPTVRTDPADPLERAVRADPANPTRPAAPPALDSPFDCLPAPIPSRRSLTLIALVAILASLAAMAALLAPELLAL